MGIPLPLDLWNLRFSEELRFDPRGSIICGQNPGNKRLAQTLSRSKRHLAGAMMEEKDCGRQGQMSQASVEITVRRGWCAAPKCRTVQPEPDLRARAVPKMWYEVGRMAGSLAGRWTFKVVRDGLANRRNAYTLHADDPIRSVGQSTIHRRASHSLAGVAGFEPTETCPDFH
jgi:hypothetical protein